MFIYLPLRCSSPHLMKPSLSNYFYSIVCSTNYYSIFPLSIIGVVLQTTILVRPYLIYIHTIHIYIDTYLNCSILVLILDFCEISVIFKLGNCVCVYIVIDIGCNHNSWILVLETMLTTSNFICDSGPGSSESDVRGPYCRKCMQVT